VEASLGELLIDEHVTVVPRPVNTVPIPRSRQRYPIRLRTVSLLKPASEFVTTHSRSSEPPILKPSALPRSSSSIVRFYSLRTQPSFTRISSDTRPSLPSITRSDSYRPLQTVSRDRNRLETVTETVPVIGADNRVDTKVHALETTTDRALRALPTVERVAIGTTLGFL